MANVIRKSTKIEPMNRFVILLCVFVYLFFFNPVGNPDKSFKQRRRVKNRRFFTNRNMRFFVNHRNTEYNLLKETYCSDSGWKSSITLDAINYLPPGFAQRFDRIFKIRPMVLTGFKRVKHVNV